MIFRQLFDTQTSTYTYLIASEATREAVLVDPVLEEVDTYEVLLDELALKLVYTIDTHVHADHVTASSLLRERRGSRSVLHADAGVSCADVGVHHGDVLTVGDLRIEVRHTPGHTGADISLVVGDRVLTGDALLIGGCGRTDFQSGDAGTLYDSIHSALFTLPPETLLYPGHDYRGNTVSTIGKEIADNPRLGGGRSREDFINLMNGLALPPPRLIDRAVPANQACGREVPS